MKKNKVLLVMCAIVGIAVNTSAQTRRYDVLMKEIQTTFTSLKGNLTVEKAANGAQQAMELKNLFKETEQFWAKFETKSAMSAAVAAQTAADTIVSNLNEGKFPEASRSYTTLGNTCLNCHTFHRWETADGSYRIKP